MKLVASMIVRNELDRYLKPAIEHLLTFCDEIRVLDDSSDDGTLEYLKGLQPDRVYVSTTLEPSFYVHEGRTRQALLEWTLEAKPTYVLSIDADEFVSDPLVVQSAMGQGGEVYTLQMTEIWNANDVNLRVRIDNQWRPRPCPILWRVPKDSSSLKIPDVQLACGREPIDVRRTRAKVSGSQVLHFGWACEADRVERAERYFEHDKGRFHADRHLQSILWGDDRVQVNTMHWPAALANIRDALTERAARGSN